MTTAGVCPLEIFACNRSSSSKVESLCHDAAVAALSVHHLGVAVGDVDAAVLRYGSLFGAEVEAEELLEDQGVRAVVLRLGAEGRVELLEPLEQDTPVGRFLARRGEGMHHVAYGVADLESELRRLRGDGVELIDETPRHGVFGAVAFIHPDAVLGVLTELVQA
jgi:methylmalonyl-CoA epimerase